MDSKPAPRNSHPKNETSKTANREIGAPRKPSPFWHSRGYIPHFEIPDKIQHVTFHLADSLPQAILRQLDAKLENVQAGKRELERRKHMEALIDAGLGSCILRKPVVAQMVQNSLLAFDGDHYRLLAWVVMPNHVHVLFEPVTAWSVAKIVSSWKKFTARKICDHLTANSTFHVARPVRPVLPGSANLPIGAVGSVALRSAPPVWQREYWDRYIRDERHLNRTVEYIHQNPVKAGLVATAEGWPWSSANPNHRATQTSK